MEWQFLLGWDERLSFGCIHSKQPIGVIFSPFVGIGSILGASRIISNHAADHG